MGRQARLAYDRQAANAPVPGCTYALCTQPAPVRHPGVPSVDVTEASKGTVQITPACRPNRDRNEQFEFPVIKQESLELAIYHSVPAITSFPQQELCRSRG